MASSCTDLQFFVDEQNPYSTIENCENILKLLSSIELSSGGQLCEQAEAGLSLIQIQVAAAIGRAREQFINRERAMEKKLAELKFAS